MVILHDANEQPHLSIAHTIPPSLCTIIIVISGVAEGLLVRT